VTLTGMIGIVAKLSSKMARISVPEISSPGYQAFRIARLHHSGSRAARQPSAERCEPAIGHRQRRERRNCVNDVFLVFALPARALIPAGQPPLYVGPLSARRDALDDRTFIVARRDGSAVSFVALSYCVVEDRVVECAEPGHGQDCGALRGKVDR